MKTEPRKPPTLTSEDDRVGKRGRSAKAGRRGLDIQLDSNSSSRKRIKGRGNLAKKQ